mgnify:CR=1 FL=1
MDDEGRLSESIKQIRSFDAYIEPAYFLASGFSLNPKYKIIQGIKSYFSIDQIPTQIDFVVIAVKASLVSDQIKAAAKKGAKTALIFSSGFSETGENGGVFGNGAQGIGAFHFNFSSNRPLLKLH